MRRFTTALSILLLVTACSRDAAENEAAEDPYGANANIDSTTMSGTAAQTGTAPMSATGTTEVSPTDTSSTIVTPTTTTASMSSPTETTATVVTRTTKPGQ